MRKSVFLKSMSAINPTIDEIDEIVMSLPIFLFFSDIYPFFV